MTVTDDLRLRTKNFALRVIRLYQMLPTSGAPQMIGKQLLRCGTSVGANYRGAGRARSRAEFAAKLGIVVEEADESMYWLELLSESKTVKAELLADLQREAKELTAIFTTARQSAKR
jgi:four helix bundle protein